MFFRKSSEKILAQESPKKVVFDVVERLGRKREYADYRDAEKMVWCLNLLFAESKNGTLEQYAANSSGDLFEDTRTYLEAIKAFKAQEILEDLNRLLNTVRNALDRKELVVENKRLKKKVSKNYEMVGESKAIEKIKLMIDKVAPTDARVLITGPNGTGKEIVAHWLHLVTLDHKVPGTSTLGRYIAI